MEKKKIRRIRLKNKRDDIKIWKIRNWIIVSKFAG
jgi:hypothetical protein